MSYNECLLPSLNSKKWKEALIDHDGELREGNHFANKWQFVVTFEYGTCLHIISVNWVFIWSLWQSTFMSHATPLSLSKECIVHHRTMCLSGLVMLPSHFVPMFKGDLKNFYLYSLHSLCVSIFESVLWLLHSHHSRTMFWVSCCRCGTHHGPPSMILPPSTSTHHLGNTLRNNI